jgi:hypothetical protein
MIAKGVRQINYHFKINHGAILLREIIRWHREGAYRYI